MVSDFKLNASGTDASFCLSLLKFQGLRRSLSRLRPKVCTFIFKNLLFCYLLAVGSFTNPGYMNSCMIDDVVVKL